MTSEQRATTGAGAGAARPARRLRSLRRRRVLGHEVHVADTAISRGLGLALLSRRRAANGLLLVGCRAVHTAGMRFPIEARFIDASNRELRRVVLPPWRAAADRRADAVLELPIDGEIGTAASAGEEGRRAS